MTPPSDERLLDVLERGRRLGFLGPGPVGAHLDHALGLGTILDLVLAGAMPVVDGPVVDGPVLDLGAGGGVPGLVLAALGPRRRWTLLDANERRTDFLRLVVDELDLGERVAVVRGRAEEVARQTEHRERYVAVVARSFAGPSPTAECGAPFVLTGGSLLVTEPPEERVARWSPEALARLGLVPSARHDRPVAVMELRKVAPCPEWVPRRQGVPAKRPLF